MKIIQHGYKMHTIIFKCTNCGCIFEATEDEFFPLPYDYFSHQTRVRSKCPECGETVYRINNDIDWEPIKEKADI